MLLRRNIEATRNYSLHTTGWAFDIPRRYGSRAQALAFQFMLDRLTALNLIAWVREPGAIHVTAGPRAQLLLPLLASPADGYPAASPAQLRRTCAMNRRTRGYVWPPRADRGSDVARDGGRATCPPRARRG